jgi:hypothetical protein
MGGKGEDGGMKRRAIKWSVLILDDKNDTDQITNLKVASVGIYHFFVVRNVSFFVVWNVPCESFLTRFL